MEKIKTDNEFTFIIEEDSRKYIRKYKRHNYYKTVPINIIMKLVNSSKVYAPNLLKNNTKYVDLEYIKGDYVDKDFDKKILIETMINYLVYLQNIDCRKIHKYIHWKTNTEYLTYLVNSLSKLKRSFTHNTKIIIELLNIGNDELDKLKLYKLDDHRKMSLIHGDISYDNMLLKFNRIYLLNWDLATFADIAHEIAIHFEKVDYTDKQKEHILEMLSKKLNINLTRLKKDIKVYTIYENLKETYLKINNITKQVKKNENIEKELKELYTCYTSLEHLTKINALPFNEVEEVFKRIK